MGLNDLNKKKFIHSGVIVLHEHVSDSLILTQRSNQLRAHPGEICFPGGTWEEGDKSFYDTALRELSEEMGIAADRVCLVKKLKTEQTLLGRIIYPWYACIESIIPFHLNTKEVSRIIAIPMPLVQDEKNYRDFFIEQEGQQFKTSEFTANRDWVWGATARIMKQLVKL